jgi:hypothetical protein
LPDPVGPTVHAQQYLLAGIGGQRIAKKPCVRRRKQLLGPTDVPPREGKIASVDALAVVV